MLGPQPSFGGKAFGSLDSFDSQQLYSQDGAIRDDAQPPRRAQGQAEKKLNSYTELLDIKILKEVRAKFLEHGTGETGDSLKVEDFIDILSAYIPRQDVENVYKKIDVNDDGYVDWHEFTGFLINADAMKGTTAYGPMFRPAERACQPHDRHTHRDMIEHLAFAMKPVPMIVTGCKDGSISLWNYHDLTFIGSVAHHDKSSIMVSSMIRSISTAQKAAMKVAVGRLSSSNPVDGVCITAMNTLSTTGHLCVASADCSLSIYDLATQEICGRLNNTTEMITAIQAFQSMDKRMEVPVPYIVCGDSVGYFSVIKIDYEFGASTDGGQKKKNQQIMEKTLNSGLTRIKIHDQWITKLFFLSEVDQIISASMDGKVKFINLEKMAVYKEFNGHNNTGSSVSVGVKSFVWAPAQKYICSVGTDRVILMWDPYTLDIMCKLSGLASPVMGIAVDEKHQQILASTQKKSLRTWDSVTYEALEPLEDRTDYLPSNEISCSLWVPEFGGIITAANKLKLYYIEKNAEESGTVEQDDITCVLFNTVFHQVVVVSNSGKIKVYLSEDGSVVSQFDAQSVCTSNSMIEDKELSLERKLGSFIKNASFDSPKRRLIVVTTANDVQFWNCHNGSNLCVVTPRVPPYLQGNMAGLYSNNLSISCFLHESIVFPAAQQVGGGSSRTVVKKHLLLGLNNGIILGLHESDVLAEDASLLLVRSATTHAKSMARKGGQLDRGDSVISQADIASNGTETADATVDARIGRRASLRRQSSVAPRLSNCSTLWMSAAGNSESNIFAGYSDGIVLLWDVATSTVIMHMEGDSPGASFSCMRRRIIASRNRAPPMTVYLEQQRKMQKERSGENDLKTLKQAKTAIEKKNVKTAAPGDITHFSFEYLSVENDMIPSESAVLTASLSLASQTTATRKPLNLAAASRSNSMARPKSATLSGNKNSLINSASPFSFLSFSRGSVVGVGKRKDSVSAVPSHDTGDILPTSPVATRVKTRPASLRSKLENGLDFDDNNSFCSSQQKIVQNLPSLQHENNEDAEGSQKEHKLLFITRQSSRGSDSACRPHTPKVLRDKQNSTVASEAWASSYRSRENSPDNNIISRHPLSYLPVVIYHSVVSMRYRLLFGACNDGLLRVWDLDCGEVICSCYLTHSAEEIKMIKSKGDSNQLQHDDSESSISKLCTSEKSNHIVGGYDDGLIRVWLMGPHSTGQLRTVTVTDNGELAIPPLQYHTEWLAHDTAVTGIEVINRENQNGGCTTYIVTSGQAQGVYMWTASGKLVGTFGASEWIISDNRTWKPKPIDHVELKMYHQAARPRRAPAVTDPIGEATTPGYEWGGGLDRGLKLALYMEFEIQKQKIRAQNRQSTATYAIQDGHFSEVQVRHPVSTPQPPSSSHRSSNNRSLRRDKHSYQEPHSATSGGNINSPARRNKNNSTLAGRLNATLAACADENLQKLIGEKSPPQTKASTPLDKLRSITSAASFGVRVGGQASTRRNSGSGSANRRNSGVGLSTSASRGQAVPAIKTPSSPRSQGLSGGVNSTNSPESFPVKQ